jgi:hypothetical protein
MSGVMLNKDERGIRTDESVNMSDWKIKKKKRIVPKKALE